MKKIIKIISFFIFLILSSCSGILALADIHIHSCYFCGKDKICKKTTFLGIEIYYCEDCEYKLGL